MALHASPSCLVEGLWAQSERTPDALAVVFTAEDGERTRVSAGELRASAGRSTNGDKHLDEAAQRT